MSALLTLENFAAISPASSALFPAFGAEPTGAEDALLSSADEPDPAGNAQYETGYRAGWEDCDRTAQERRLAIAEELARSLQDLSFTYHEARSHILAQIAPVLQVMAEKLLPGMAGDNFARIVVAELSALAGEQAEGPLTLLVAPGSVDELVALMGDAPPLSCTVVPEPSLGPFQACFRVGSRETLLDVDGVLARIQAAVAALAPRPMRDAANG